MRRDEGFGKSSRKNGDHVHYRPVNSHSLTTHFLDRRRHFFFYAGTIEANEISPSREFEESFISTTLYCTVRHVELCDIDLPSKPIFILASIRF